MPYKRLIGALLGAVVAGSLYFLGHDATEWRAWVAAFAIIFTAALYNAYPEND